MCNDIVMISAYAKLPTNTTSEAVYKTLALATLVDMEERTIVSAECSMITNLTKQFISRLMTGYNLDNGPDVLLARFESTYYGHAKKAIETAIKMIFSQYNDIKAARGLD